MKIAPTASAFSNYDKQLRDKPILPLLDEDEGVEIDDSRATTFKLRTVPADADSAKYTFKVPIIDGAATPRQSIKWYVAMNKVFTGLALADATNRHNLLQEMCSGAAKSSYETAVNANRAKRRHDLGQTAVNNELPQQGGESNADYQLRLKTAYKGVPMPAVHNDDIEAGMQAIIEAACPYKALAKQKRFMRRKMRKPIDMTTRKYVNTLIRINDEELTKLPPFQGDAQKLAGDEIVDIVCYGIPRSWMRKMDEHDFDPFRSQLGDLIAFCERMEASEEHDKGSDAKVSSSKKSKKHKSTRNNPNKGASKWCDFHEVDTHDTADCETLKKLKASRSSSSDKKPAFKNKTWKRKSDDAKTYTKKELSTIVEKATKAAVKKASSKKAECNAVTKRKANDSDSHSESDSECSLNMMDTKMAEVDRQLADFNFDNSDGEISV